MASWPGSLPEYVLQEGYDEKFADQSVESPMDAGLAKMRRRFTTNSRRFEVVCIMDNTQVAAFETFYYTTLAAGTLPFDWVHPRTRASVEFRFRKPVPSITPKSGEDFNVRFSLELMP